MFTKCIPKAINNVQNLGKFHSFKLKLRVDITDK